VNKIMNKLSKFKFYNLIIVISFFLFSVIGYAENNEDPCANVSGTWYGSANVKLFVFSCKYDATVKVAEGNPAVVMIDAVKSGGNFFCPKNITHNANAVCNAGKISIKDNKLDVAGELSSDRKSVGLSGSINVMGKHPISLILNKL
jgi:hypothetical protein